jgi:hypothetical protein
MAPDSRGADMHRVAIAGVLLAAVLLWVGLSETERTNEKENTP